MLLWVFFNGKVVLFAFCAFRFLFAHFYFFFLIKMSISVAVVTLAGGILVSKASHLVFYLDSNGPFPSWEILLMVFSFIILP